MPEKISQIPQKRGLIGLIKDLSAPPTPVQRLRNTLTNILLTYCSSQVGIIIYREAMKIYNSFGAETTQQNAIVMSAQIEGLNKLDWVTYGLFGLALTGAFHNAIMFTLEVGRNKGTNGS